MTDGDHCRERLKRPARLAPVLERCPTLSSCRSCRFCRFMGGPNKDNASSPRSGGEGGTPERDGKGAAEGGASGRGHPWWLA
jgi:hypothetical protein